MNCTDYQDIIHSYLGGELDEQLQVKVESHVANCSDCSRELANWQTSLSQLRKTFPEQTPPAELWEKIRVKTKA